MHIRISLALLVALLAGPGLMAFPLMLPGPAAPRRPTTAVIPLAAGGLVPGGPHRIVSPARPAASQSPSTRPGPAAPRWAWAAATPTPGSYTWPVRGPVLRPFEQPSGPFGPGHRGIDIGAPFGTRVVASQAGVVAFAGWVAGSLFVSIDHPDGVRTTYSWLSSTLVAAGESVSLGQPIATTGQGHPGSARPHIHFGARIGETYIDPMVLLGDWSLVGLVHLAPLEEASP